MTAGRLYDLGPDGTAFTPPALLTFNYSADEVRRLGMAEGELTLFVYDQPVGFRKVSNQVLDTAAQRITASLSQVASVYGIFGSIPDRLPPRTAMRIGEPMFVSSQTYITSATELSLGATDDLLVLGDGTGLGVDRTEYSFDEGSFARYSAPVKLLGEGPHAVAFFSVDLLGHVETTQSQALALDDTPPATAVAVSTPSYGSYVSPLPTVKLSAQDSAAGSVPGSGIAKRM